MTPAMDCLAIDPGPTISAWVEIRNGLPRRCGLDGNDIVRRVIEDMRIYGVDGFAIERFASYGCAIGEESIATVMWTGRFIEAAIRCGINEKNVTLLRRVDIRLHHCHSMRSNDSTVRQALIDRFGGKDKAIGKKADPGPLYFLKADMWSALAVGLMWYDVHSFAAHLKRQKPV